MNLRKIFALTVIWTAILASVSWLAISHAQGGAIPFNQYKLYASYSHTNMSNPISVTGDMTQGYLTLFIGDLHSHVIRRFVNGTFTTLAGSGTAGFADGSLYSAQFDHPSGLSGGTGKWLYTYPCPNNPRQKCQTWEYYVILYVTDSNNSTIRRICYGAVPSGGVCSSTNTVTTVAGNHTVGFVNGPSLSSEFYVPSALYGSYVSDTGNNSIRLWSSGNVSTYAGTGTAGLVNGPRASAEFNSPSHITSDTSNNLYVADAGNHVIRKIDTTGNVTTFAGSGTPGYQDGAGTSASFFLPTSIAFNPADGFLYVIDSTNNRIRRIDLSGNVTTYAGSGQAGETNGSLSQSSFQHPSDLLILDGFMYVADTMNNCIRRIDMVNGVVSTFIS